MTPLYRAVEAPILGEIEAGKLVPGDLIPSEPELAMRLRVSQGTAKKAIDNLVKERRLYRHQGKGTYVSSIDFNRSLFRFFSYGDAGGDAIRIHKETPMRRVDRGPPEICSRLGVPEGTELLQLQRIGYAEGIPVLEEQSWWLADVVAGLEDEDVHIPDLLYAVVVGKIPAANIALRGDPHRGCRGPTDRQAP